MANGPTTPPPGSVPGSFSPADMESLATQMGQAGAVPPGSPGSTGDTPDPSGLPTQAPQSMTPPRAIGSLPQEAKYLTEDIGQGVMNLLPDIIQEILGIKNTDTPEQKAKKKQMLANFQQLEADQQAVVAKKLQEQKQAEQMEEEEVYRKRQEEMAASQDDIGMPTGKVTGEAAAGASNKQRTMQKLQSDRKKPPSAG